MKLSLSTLDTFAEMICGASGGYGGYEWPMFPYRSSSYLTEFFRKCNLPYQHDGSTRKTWVYEVLEELNHRDATNPDLPPDEIIEVIKQLTNPIEFEKEELDHEAAVTKVNKALNRDSLQVRIISGQCIIENLATRATSQGGSFGRLMSREETTRRQAFEDFLNSASEDKFTEELLVPLFTKLGFDRVTASGHQDKLMEFGKDMWMKYRLPTQHWLYVGVQVKKERIHSAGSELNRNVSGILAQLLMLMTYPVFDQETNSRHLVDHVYLVSSGEITKQARTLLSQFLDNAMRRNILFMDKEDILDLCVIYSLPLPKSLPKSSTSDRGNIPF